MTEFVVGESVFTDGSVSDFEALRIFFEVADERGHPGPSVVVDDHGRPITHPAYSDRMGTPHVKAGAWAFCRKPMAEALGLPSGTDWIREHCPQLIFSSGSPYRNVPHFHDQLYVQHFGSAEPQLMIPVCTAHPIAWSTDGSHICVLETRLGHITEGTGMAQYVLWEYELALGSRRRVAGFPAPARLDFTQLAISCAEIDKPATDEVLSELQQHLDRDPVTRAVLRSTASGHRLGSPLTAIPKPPDRRGSVSGQPPPPQQSSPAEPSVAAALDRLVEADNLGEAAQAVQQLLREARRAGQPPDRTWDWLATLTTTALGRADYPFAARVGLATLLWTGFFLPDNPQLTRLGLGPTPPPAELTLLLNCFEACTHLPERTILGQDRHTIFDAETTRNWCQAGLSRLPLDEHLTHRNQATSSRAAIAPPADPTTDRHADTAAPHLSRHRRVFVSYVREDTAIVDQIAHALRNHGIDPWLDRTHINPGERWQRAVRHAIRDGNYFLACFSPSYAQRTRTYMNEELRLAVEQLRLMPLSRRWFIPIILKPCQIPDFQIDSIETFENIQHIDFSHDWDAAISQLIKTIS
jgi:hypothetical protein